MMVCLRIRRTLLDVDANLLSPPAFPHIRTSLVCPYGMRPAHVSFARHTFRTVAQGNRPILWQLVSAQLVAESFLCVTLCAILGSRRDQR